MKNILKYLITFSFLMTIPYGLTALSPKNSSSEISPTGTPHTSSSLCNIHDSLNRHTIGKANSNFCKTDTNLMGKTVSGARNSSTKHLYTKQEHIGNKTSSEKFHPSTSKSTKTPHSYHLHHK